MNHPWDICKDPSLNENIVHKHCSETEMVPKSPTMDLWLSTRSKKNGEWNANKIDLTTCQKMKGINMELDKEQRQFDTH
jgi:hypothetical protein